MKDELSRLRISPGVRMPSQLIENPQLQSERQIKIISEVPRQIARPYIVRHVQIAVPIQKVIAQRARYSLVMNHSRIFGKPDWQISLSRLRMLMKMLDSLYLRLAQLSAASTPAGIVQNMQSDSRPLLLDEFDNLRRVF